jgi:hypothetical protein
MFWLFFKWNIRLVGPVTTIHYSLLYYRTLVLGEIWGNLHETKGKLWKTLNDVIYNDKRDTICKPYLYKVFWFWTFYSFVHLIFLYAVYIICEFSHVHANILCRRKEWIWFFLAAIQILKLNKISGIRPDNQYQVQVGSLIRR